MAQTSPITKGLNILAILAIICVPFLYSGLFTWAYSDPIHHLNNLPAAIVNNDQGATVHPSDALDAKGATLHLGDDIVQELLDDTQSFGWHLTTADQAQAGLQDGTYTAVLTLPGDLSQRVSTLSTHDAHQAATTAITIETNDAVSYTAGTFASSVGDAVELSVNKAAAKGYISGVLGSFTKIGESLGDASKGAGDLAQGAAKLGDGASQLHQGASDLGVGLQTLTHGATTLQQGVSVLSAKTGDAAKASHQLDAGQHALAAGATQAQSGAQAIHLGLNNTAQGATQLVGGLDQLATSTAQLPTQTSQLASGAQALVSGSTQLGEGLGQARKGAADIHAGLGTLQTSVQPLPAQSTQLANGATQVAQGLQAMQTQLGPLLPPSARTQLAQLVQGAQAVQAGTSQLAAQTQPLVDGITALNTGAQALDTGLASAVGANEAITQGATKLAQGTGALAQATPALTQGIQDAKGGAVALQGAIGQLHTGSQSLLDGVTSIATNATTLADGTKTLSGGLTALAQGAQSAHQGARDIHAGLRSASAATTKMTSGVMSLQDGLNQAKSGANELSTRLRDGQHDVPTYSEESQDHIATIAAAPITIDKQRLNAVTNNGAGFAPFVITLSLWIGGMSMFFLFPALDKRRSPEEPWYLTWVRPMMTTATLGLAQAVTVILGMTALLGLSAETSSSLAVITLLTSLAFVFVNQALLSVFGYRGRFVSLLLMIVQITSMGGTYPVQTAPGFFQTMHELLPMTYISNVVRSIIAGGSLSIIPAILWIAALLVVALLTVIAVAWIRRDRLAYVDPISNFVPNTRTSELGRLLPDSLLPAASPPVQHLAPPPSPPPPPGMNYPSASCPSKQGRAGRRRSPIGTIAKGL